MKRKAVERTECEGLPVREGMELRGSFFSLSRTSLISLNNRLLFIGTKIVTSEFFWICTFSGPHISSLQLEQVHGIFVGAFFG